ncbi:MAG: hypothetical protein A2079_01720 [Geobacteraceae bacterium GWC2_48_7]|nr:MAG: hypothetical protein A2079_01720 [Geobacteraceae bacterium GWC2_48_7]
MASQNQMISQNYEQHHHVRLDGDTTVMDELVRLQETKQLHGLQLLNYYKEVPITGTASDFRIFENTLFCRTNEAQARIIEFSKNTILKSENLQNHVYASAEYDPETREVALTDFSYVELLSRKREAIRVRMHIPLTVLIESGARNFKGRLIDLSLDGCAIDVATHELEDTKAYSYLNINMPLKTGLEQIKVRVMASFLKASQHFRLSRCIYLFEHDMYSENQIGKQIALRQGEILRELQ